MSKRPALNSCTKGQYAAEADVNLIDTDNGWSPSLSSVGSKRFRCLRAPARQAGFQLFDSQSENHRERHEDGDADEDDVYFVVGRRRRDHITQSLA